MCKQPDDESSCADAQCDRNQKYGCQSEPVNKVGTEGVVFEPVHKSPSRSICDNEDGRDRTNEF